ncbi:restriction endonuclease subunit S [Nocardia cyriacigeorgica]|uniref:restriction endonuclease subunit S n=1 Tax=Nocardia cyriacigeorgica TaxID=135487 RepID=UPI002457A7D6|nr:restriction endonuclease subunit S [Nocardia cyriacigeorgica]
MSDVLGIALPDRWAAVPLKRVTTLVNRGTAPTYVDDSGVRMVSQAANQAAGLDWDRCRFHDFNGDATRLKGHLQPGDILVNSTGTGTLGRVGYFVQSPDSRPCVADGHVTVVRAASDLYSRFAYYWLKSQPFSEFVYAALTVGATNQIELNRERLRDAPVPVPSLEEQRRIADFLDAETSRIDRLVFLGMRSIKGLEERGGAIVDREVLQSSSSTTKLFYGLSVLRDGTHQPPQRTASGVRFLTARNVSTGVLRTTEFDSFVSEEDAASLEKSFEVIPGDILLSVKGTVGACAIVPVEFGRVVLDRNVALLRVVDGASSLWLTYVLRSRFVQDQMRISITAAAQPGLPLGVIRQLRVPDVQFSMQHSLANRVAMVWEDLANLRAAIERRNRLLSERRQALITAAVTGQFDVSTASGRNTTQGV